MKCPVCDEENKKSRVYPEGSMETCMGYVPYYDEDGHYHVHNRNSRTTGYHCSEGHCWDIITRRGCPSYPDRCDFEPVEKTHLRKKPRNAGGLVIDNSDLNSEITLEVDKGSKIIVG